MRSKKLFAVIAFLIGAALSRPLDSQGEKKLSNWSIISCNVDGTYTCSSQQCIPGYCCPV
jgi:hypothetical protein